MHSTSKNVRPVGWGVRGVRSNCPHPSEGPGGSQLALFPGLHHLWLHKEHRGSGNFSHVRDVKGRKGT